NIHADTEVCFALLKNCDFGFVHQILTFTRLRAGSENTVSASRQSYFAGMLHIVLQHGAFYLSSTELKQYLDRLISKYYRFLGKSLLLRRDKNFWDYHTNQLSQLGFEFSRARLYFAALMGLCAATMNPRNVINKIFGKQLVGTP